MSKSTQTPLTQRSDGSQLLKQDILLSFVFSLKVTRGQIELACYEFQYIMKLFLVFFYLLCPKHQVVKSISNVFCVAAFKCCWEACPSQGFAPEL